MPASRSKQDQKRTDTLVLRLLWVVDRSPYHLNTIIKFINGTNHGTIRWTEDQGNGNASRIIRWTEKTLPNRVSQFTAVVMREIYGVEETQCDETERDDPVVVALEWNDYPYTFYMGFDNEKQMNTWLLPHIKWLTYERRR